MWSRPIPSPWHIYKDDLMKLNLQTVSFAADAMRMLNGASLSVSGLYSIAGVDWLIAAGINFSSTTAVRFADLEGLPSNNTMGPVNDHLHSRGFLSRLREPTAAEAAVWPAIKDILESMGEVVDTLEEGSFPKKTPGAVFALSPGYARLPDGQKFVYAIAALLSEGKCDLIISAPNREIEIENLRPLRAELPALWSDI